MSDEIQRITDSYARRKNISPDRYSRLNPAVNAIFQERQRAMIRLFSEQGIASLSDAKILEVGCGSGSNLLELLSLGAKPSNIVANELLADRVEMAVEGLPSGVRILSGDATKLQFPDEMFDIVYQSTVFSSILDDALQEALAAAMWKWTRPGGGVLWYDFIYNNPNNPDVRGVTIKRVRELFPEGRFFLRRITLAPPVARRVVRVHPAFYGIFNMIPLARTHIICYIAK